ncbi:MAG: tRNA lysidine(34) synthetase TilS [Lachnospiraceae bacterium]|nr:tRNA lysidine(34) synthetase TilS [Lachnospiraceae bacterium]
MVSKVVNFIEEYNMIEKNDLVAAGVSGGADSLCLLFMLLEYQKRVPFEIVVVHINHGIRKDALHDVNVVRKICEKENLHFYLKQYDVAELAKQEHLSEEEAGRKVRYEAFKEALERFGKPNHKARKIAVAHHQGDSAETLLFHLFRGTGIWGMSGILPINGNIIRPLLTCSRKEIEEYLVRRGQSWCIDSTNAEDTYTRNKIRHHILEYADKEINEGATRHVANAAMHLLSLRQYINEEVEAIARNISKREETAIQTDLVKLKAYPVFLQQQYWLWALDYILPGRKNVTTKHIEALLGLVEKKESKKIDLPGNMEAIKEYHILTIQKREEKIETPKEVFLEGQGCYLLQDGLCLEISHLNVEEIGEIEENQYTKYLDYDKIRCCLKVRNRQPGDYITINDKGQTKSLKEYFIQEKIPASIRSRIPVIADNNHILWVIGHRISAYYKVTSETRKVIKMTIRRDKNVRKN